MARVRRLDRRAPCRPVPVSAATTPGSHGRKQHHHGHRRAPRPERATRPRLGASSRSRQQRDHAGYPLSSRRCRASCDCRSAGRQPRRYLLHPARAPLRAVRCPPERLRGDDTISAPSGELVTPATLLTLLARSPAASPARAIDRLFSTGRRAHARVGEARVVACDPTAERPPTLAGPAPFSESRS